MARERSLLGCERPIARAALPTDLPTIDGFGDLTQVAVITPDAEATVIALGAALGAGAFKLVDMGPPALFDTTMDGAPEAWTMRLGITWIGQMQLEVIQPLEGRTTMTEYLAARGGRAGVQHVFLDRGRVAYDDALARFDGAGYPLVQQAAMNAAGRIGPVPMPAMPAFLASKLGARFGYTRSRDALGLDVELARFPPGVSQRLALRAAIPDKWLPDGDSTHFETLPDDAPLDDIDGVYVLTADVEAMAAAYGALTGGAPKVTAESDLPGAVRVAPMRFGSALLCPVEPKSGPLVDLLAERGPGVTLLRARPAAGAADGLEARGWSIAGDREGAFLAAHADVPFALWVAPR